MEQMCHMKICGIGGTEEAPFVECEVQEGEFNGRTVQYRVDRFKEIVRGSDPSGAECVQALDREIQRAFQAFKEGRDFIAIQEGTLPQTSIAFPEQLVEEERAITKKRVSEEEEAPRTRPRVVSEEKELSGVSPALAAAPPVPTHVVAHQMLQQMSTQLSELQLFLGAFQRPSEQPGPTSPIDVNHLAASGGAPLAALPQNLTSMMDSLMQLMAKKR